MSEVAFEVNGIRIVPDLSTAAWIPSMTTLVVADLHFEKGSSFAQRGLHLPPYDTRATLRRLAEVVERRKPARVIALGDSFHDLGGPARLDKDDAAAIRNLTSVCDWVWVHGNHDPVSSEAMKSLGGRGCEEIEEGGLLFRHEPTGTRGEVAGHLHPGAAIRQRGRRLRRRCFVTDGRSLVLPAFGAYTGSLNVLDEAFFPLFGSGLCAFLVGRDAIYPVAERRLLPDVKTDLAPTGIRFA